MAHHIHHVHIFASDIDKSVRFYQEYFGARLILDAEFAGARNVFMRIGNGRLHLYDQPPKNPGTGSIHHFGIQTEFLPSSQIISSRIVSLNKWGRGLKGRRVDG